MIMHLMTYAEAAQEQYIGQKAGLKSLKLVRSRVSPQHWQVEEGPFTVAEVLGGMLRTLRLRGMAPADEVAKVAKFVEQAWNVYVNTGDSQSYQDALAHYEFVMGTEFSGLVATCPTCGDEMEDGQDQCGDCQVMQLQEQYDSKPLY